MPAGNITDRIPFTIVAETAYGPMILHRLDAGQGWPAIQTGRPLGFDEIRILSDLARRLGDRCVFLDVGANVGFFAVALGHAIGERGRVYCFEGQRIIFNMLAGSVALNGLLNVVCVNACVGRESGKLELPAFDYTRPLSFGSVEFGTEQRERLSQDRRMGQDPEFVPLITIDSMSLPKVSIIKIDVEGMEIDVLDGARDTIRLNKPIIFAEYLKCGLNPLSEWLEGQGYTVADIGGYNLLALPNEGANRLDDPRQVIEQLTKPPQQLPEAFNADVYLALHRDVRLSGIDPGTHYLGWGWREGRRYR